MNMCLRDGFKPKEPADIPQFDTAKIFKLVEIWSLQMKFNPDKHVEMMYVANDILLRNKMSKMKYSKYSSKPQTFCFDDAFLKELPKAFFYIFFFAPTQLQENKFTT
jgi:hypothetical protein